MSTKGHAKPAFDELLKNFTTTKKTPRQKLIADLEFVARELQQISCTEADEKKCHRCRALFAVNTIRQKYIATEPR